MKVRDFQGVPSIQEIQCSGTAISPDLDLLSISLFRARDDQTIAFVNFASEECSTFVGFSACVFEEKDSHRTHVKALVQDLEPGQIRRYGCNVTAALKGKTLILREVLDIVGKQLLLDQVPFGGLM
ncbi:hypothetical protein ACOMHN_052786 [Nucella lapillus]